MDTLRSYFSRILPNNHARKGSGRWRRGRSNDRRGMRGFADGPLRSASTSQMDGLDSSGADDRYYTPPPKEPLSSFSSFDKEPLSSFSSFDKGPKPESVSDSATTSRRGQHPNHQLQGLGAVTLGRESSRTPPPSKPPRKDQVFTVALVTSGAGSELGLEVDAVATASTHRDRSGSCDAGGATADPSWGSRSSVCSPPTSSSSSLAHAPSPGLGALLPPTPGCVMRVVGVTEGGVVRRDGRVKVNDELIDVNGKSLLRESKESVR